jgi:superfamily II DNA or RNA helicase
MKITLTNNLQLAEIPPDFRDLLMEKLRLQNPKWTENVRMGRWNRGVPKELRFYDKVRSDQLWIPRGFMRQLLLLCRRHQITFEIDDRRRSLPPVPFTFEGRLKPFQKEAVDGMLAREFGTLSSATGSGKTVMALNIIAQRRQPTLIVVHTKDLANQWISRIGDFLGIAPEDVGLLGGGKKRMGEKVTLALVQTLYKCAEDIKDQVGFLLVDECHRCPSRTFTEAVTCFDSRYMMGLTATPWRRDNLSKLIFWHMGDVHHEVDGQQLVADGDVLTAKVTLRETDFHTRFDPVNEYTKMLSELTTNDTRNRMIAADIANVAAQNDGVCLVLSDRKAHCETLQSLLKYRHKASSELLTGDLSDRERASVVERLNRKEITVLIATGQLIGEGFDCRDLSVLFLATPISFSGRLLQYLGRVLRPAPGKTHALVYDYVDQHVEVLKRTAEKRQKIYQQ